MQTAIQSFLCQKLASSSYKWSDETDSGKQSTAQSNEESNKKSEKAPFNTDSNEKQKSLLNKFYDFYDRFGRQCTNLNDFRKISAKKKVLYTKKSEL